MMATFEVKRSRRKRSWRYKLSNVWNEYAIKRWSDRPIFDEFDVFIDKQGRAQKS